MSNVEQIKRAIGYHVGHFVLLKIASLPSNYTSISDDTRKLKISACVLSTSHYRLIYFRLRHPRWTISKSPLQYTYILAAPCATYTNWWPQYFHNCWAFSLVNGKSAHIRDVALQRAFFSRRNRFVSHPSHRQKDAILWATDMFVPTVSMLTAICTTNML